MIYDPSKDLLCDVCKKKLNEVEVWGFVNRKTNTPPLCAYHWYQWRKKALNDRKLRLAQSSGEKAGNTNTPVVTA